jgi:multidrug efflux pump subunit AcrA (membrane-fusion protein)
MKKNQQIILACVPVVALVAFLMLKKPGTSAETANLLVTIVEAPMTVNVYAPGELQARRSEKVKGPDGLRTVGIYQLNIASLVPEGTVVQQGQFIASLDPTELATKIKDAQVEIDKIVTQLDQAKIDTAIEMRSLRDQYVNVRFSMKEKELTLELSRYEPQAIKQQAQLDLEKAQRELDQLKSKLQLTKEKSVARIGEINASYRQLQFKLDRLMELQGQMTVLAPKAGMVIYVRDWNGKRGPGSQVSTWDPVIAELPDLSEMITKVYINEVDISKLMPGQKATITVDAFPGKEFSGVVMSKANIGEQVRNFDTKVFEVIVLLQSIDSLLRPAMTTGLTITVDSIPPCLQVPLEAIHMDSVNYVFKKTKSGFIRQEIVTGPSNDVNISIVAGLSAGDEVCLNIPKAEEIGSFAYLAIDEKQNAMAQAEKSKAERMKVQQEIAKTINPDNFSDDGGEGGMYIIF